MTITNGNISRIDGEFAKHSNISCLNLSSNHINSIEERALGSLYNLGILDLSHNNLTKVPNVRKGTLILDISSKDFQHHFYVVISTRFLDNANLICSELNTLSNRSEIIFHHENDTFCITSKDFVWFRTAEKIPFSQVKAVHEVC